jgi:acetyltransferase-like isoleucine patch superfamily enzyme
MRYAGLSTWGRIATYLATWFAPPHKSRVSLAGMNVRGYIAPSATIYHPNLRLGAHVFVGDRAILYDRKIGGTMEIGDRVYIYRDVVLETGWGGHLRIEEEASIHPRCQLNAYVGPIHIGRGVMIAPNCALYSYSHGLAPDRPIREQPMETKGGIVIGDEAWLGVGAIVVDGVEIGEGAAIGAGSVVTQDVPAGALAAGVPARVVKMRSEIARTG